MLLESAAGAALERGSMFVRRFRWYNEHNELGSIRADTLEVSQVGRWYRCRFEV